MTIAPTIETPISPADAVAVIRRATLSAGGSELLGRFMAALSHGETGGWTSTFDHNLFNMRGSGDEGQYENPKVKSESNLYAAYSSFDDAAEAGMSQMLRNFPGVFAATDLDSFIDGLEYGRLGIYWGAPVGKTRQQARDAYKALVENRYRLLFGSLPESGGAPVTMPPKAETTEEGALSPFSYSQSGRRLLSVDSDGAADLATLQLGSIGALVCVWQAIVNLEPTGIFDEKTKRATEDFQESTLDESVPLKKDGIVGPFTWTRAVMGECQ